MSSRTNVVEHIRNIYNDGELEEKQPVGIFDRYEQKERERFKEHSVLQPRSDYFPRLSHKIYCRNLLSIVATDTID